MASLSTLGGEQMLAAWCILESHSQQDSGKQMAAHHRLLYHHTRYKYYDLLYYHHHHYHDYGHIQSRPTCIALGPNEECAAR